MNSQPLFQPLDPAVKKNKEIRVRLTATEAIEIQHQADIRNLSASEFVRRAALGRKADVTYDLQIVDQLIDLIRVIRQFHESMLRLGMRPPEEIWEPLIDQALDAMLRISK